MRILLKVTRMNLFINKANEFRSGRLGVFFLMCAYVYTLTGFRCKRQKVWKLEFQLVCVWQKLRPMYGSYLKRMSHCLHSYSTKNMHISLQQLCPKCESMWAFCSHEKHCFYYCNVRRLVWSIAHQRTNKRKSQQIINYTHNHSTS